MEGCSRLGRLGPGRATLASTACFPTRVRRGGSITGHPSAVVANSSGQKSASSETPSPRCRGGGGGGVQRHVERQQRRARGRARPEAPEQPVGRLSREPSRQAPPALRVAAVRPDYRAKDEGPYRPRVCPKSEIAGGGAAIGRWSREAGYWAGDVAGKARPARLASPASARRWDGDLGGHRPAQARLAAEETGYAGGDPAGL